MTASISANATFIAGVTSTPRYLPSAMRSVCSKPSTSFRDNVAMSGSMPLTLPSSATPIRRLPPLALRNPATVLATTLVSSLLTWPRCASKRSVALNSTVAHSPRATSASTSTISGHITANPPVGLQQGQRKGQPLRFGAESPSDISDLQSPSSLGPWYAMHCQPRRAFPRPV